MDIVKGPPETYNKRLSELFAGRQVAVEEGFVVSPYDEAFEDLDVPCQYELLDFTLVDLFEAVYPDVAAAAEEVFDGVRDSLRRGSFEELRLALQIGYYLAATGRVVESEYTRGFEWLLKGQGRALVLENFDSYLRSCLEAVTQRHGGRPDSLFEAFDVATRLLGEHGVTPPMSGVIDVESSGSQSLSSVALGGDDVFVDWFEQQHGASALSADLLGWIGMNHNPLWQKLGGKFEDVVKGDLEVVSDEFASLAVDDQVGLGDVLRSSVGRGWSGAIDENPLFQKNLLRVTEAFIPDGFYAASEQRVIPFDLKVNVATAKPGQVSEENFGRLVEDADCLQTVFRGFTLRVGGKDLLVRGQWAVDEPYGELWEERGILIRGRWSCLRCWIRRRTELVMS